MVTGVYCRSGYSNQFNRKAKGSFIKTFNNISEMAKWTVDVKPRVILCNLNTLTTREQKSFMKKFKVLQRKRYD